MMNPAQLTPTLATDFAQPLPSTDGLSIMKSAVQVGSESQRQQFSPYADNGG